MTAIDAIQAAAGEFCYDLPADAATLIAEAAAWRADDDAAVRLGVYALASGALLGKEATTERVSAVLGALFPNREENSSR